MDPISRTYDPSALRDLTGGLRGRPVRPETVSPQAPENTAVTDPQEGIRPVERSGEEFRPYGADGRQESRRTGGGEAPEKNGRQSEIATNPATSDRTSGTYDLQTQQIIDRLKATEAKVKAHEAAHKAAGGAATGAISYTYARGPDGRNYIVGGEVPISISTGRTPQETISRMQQVIDAALAPADPSPQDRAVAAQAAAIQQEARQEQSASGQNGAEGQGAPAAGPAATTKDAGASAGSGSSVPQEPRVASVSERQSRNAYGDPAVSGAADNRDAAAATAPRRSDFPAARSQEDRPAQKPSGLSSETVPHPFRGISLFA